MEPVIKFGSELVGNSDKFESIPVNVIRQFPERPGEWAKKRLIIFVCPSEEKEQTAQV